MNKKRTAGERLRAFRIENELSVAEMAEALEVHKNHVCAMQSGRRRPGRDVAARIELLTGIRATEWASS